MLFLLHGYFSDYNTWYTGKAPTNDYVYFTMDLNQILNDLINDGTILPMIVVTPSCYNHFYGSWYTNSSVNGNWEDFIDQDVVHNTDSHCRTLKSPGSRGIAGHSTGGGGAMRMAIKHPEVFGAVYCHTTRF